MDEIVFELSATKYGELANNMQKVKHAKLTCKHKISIMQNRYYFINRHSPMSEVIKLLNKTSNIFQPWKWCAKPSFNQQEQKLQQEDPEKAKVYLTISSLNEFPTGFLEKLNLVPYTSALPLEQAVKEMLQVKDAQTKQDFNSDVNFEAVHSIPKQRLQTCLHIACSFNVNVSIWTPTELILLHVPTAKSTVHFLFENNDIHLLCTNQSAASLPSTSQLNVELSSQKGNEQIELKQEEMYNNEVLY